jgi:hypothetical protein
MLVQVSTVCSAELVSVVFQLKPSEEFHAILGKAYTLFEGVTG